MHVLNFKKQFALAVLEGRKTQTIRAPRVRPIKAGDTLRLYTGMRTKSCKLLREVVCTRVSPVRIASGNFRIGRKRLNWVQAGALAHLDGFANEAEFTAFFRDTHGLPFTGQLIEWGE